MDSAALVYTTAIGIDRDPAALTLLSEFFDDLPAPTTPTKLQAFYVVPEACPVCGRPGIKHRAGDCAFCVRNAATRQQAVEAGLRYWTPAESCPRCHQTAPRAVNNSQCTGCRQGTTESATARMVRQQPGLIITRAQARAMGLKVYRTGGACPRGHRAYRYVSNGVCLDCDKKTRR